MNKFAVDAFGSGVGRKCWEVFFDNTEHACSFCMRDKLINDAGELSPPHPWEHFFEKTGKWYMCRSQALRWPNGRMVILLVAADITEHKHAEEKLQSIIEEKEHLFNEVHHRVKNNLQSLIYLIAMQADSVESRNAVEILNELKERIRAMSHVHSQLYNSKKLSSIDFGKYVCQLLNTLLRALAVEHISTGVNITEIHLDIKSAIPCGLIINELVTNIIKHAFNDYRSRGIMPEIKISMTKTGSQYILTVRDNGVGFKKRSSYMTGSSLGLKLVNIWATHQLGGTMEINDNSGVEFVISFPVSRG
jgi:two-component sensor histidine kinase